MPNVLSDLEAKLADEKNALTPLVQAESAALANAATQTAARVGQELQVAAIAAAHVAARGALLGEKVVAEVKADASKAWGWFLRIGVPVVTAAGGGLWWFWPKL